MSPRRTTATITRSAHKVNNKVTKKPEPDEATMHCPLTKVDGIKDFLNIEREPEHEPFFDSDLKGVHRQSLKAGKQPQYHLDIRLYTSSTGGDADGAWLCATLMAKHNPDERDERTDDSL